MGKNQLLDSKQKQSREIMIFILVMSLSGLENLVAEIIPELKLGPIELGISSFIFIPITLAILFNSFWAALAAPIGEIIFADLPLGEFGGLGEFEEVVLLTIGLYLAAKLVKDVTNRSQIIIATMIGFGFEEIMSTLIDIAKVWVGIEEFEAVPGLPQSIFVVEGVDFLVEFIITGIIFGLIPTLYFLPRLYGKIEPLLGIKPREKQTSISMSEIFKPGMVIGSAVATLAGWGIAFLSEMGYNLVEWEPEFLDQFGTIYILVPIILSLLVFAAIILFARKKSSKSM